MIEIGFSDSSFLRGFPKPPRIAPYHVGELSSLIDECADKDLRRVCRDGHHSRRRCIVELCLGCATAGEAPRPRHDGEGRSAIRLQSFFIQFPLMASANPVLRKVSNSLKLTTTPGREAIVNAGVEFRTRRVSNNEVKPPTQTEG